MLLWRLNVYQTPKIDAQLMLNFPYSLRLKSLLGPGFLTYKVIRSKILSFQQPIGIVSESLNETENSSWERSYTICSRPQVSPRWARAEASFVRSSAILSLPLIWLLSV